MTTFVAIYRGQTIAEARLIAVSAAPDLVSDVTSRLLKKKPNQNEDPVLEGLESGRRTALRLIRQEANSEGLASL